MNEKCCGDHGDCLCKANPFDVYLDEANKLRYQSAAVPFFSGFWQPMPEVPADLLITKEEFEGEDYDLSTALVYCSQSYPHTIEDVKKILAVIEGTNDEESWHWLVELRDGRYAYITGGCDYTGWDCQGYVESYVADTLYEALNEAPVTDDHYVHHSEDYHEPIRAELANQLATGKALTWRERRPLG